MESKHRKVIMVLALLVLLVLLYIGRVNPRKTIKYTVPVIRVSDAGGMYEIKVNTEKKETYYIENGDEYRLTGTRSNAKGRLAILDEKGIKPKNTIEGKKPKGVMLWESTLNESAEYIKYLEEDGYKLSMVVETPEYIEVYLSKGEQLKRRVLVQRGEMMTGELEEGVELPERWGYLSMYTTEEEIERLKAEREGGKENE